MTSASPIRAVMLDMDGVLFHGDRAIPAARPFLRRLSGVPHVFLTNNPILPPDQVCEKMQRLGFARPDPAQVITSGVACAAYLHARSPSGFRYFAVGASGLDALLSEFGQADSENAEYVIVGEGPGLDFERLTTGINLIIKRGATLISTNPDPNVDASVDGRHVILPGGGALVAAFEKASGQTALTIGKPEPLLYEIALQRLAAEPAQTLMIGDRPDTDIAGAARIGLQTALVRTGRFGPAERYPAELPQPDHDVMDLDQLTGLLPPIR